MNRTHGLLNVLLGAALTASGFYAGRESGGSAAVLTTRLQCETQHFARLEQAIYFCVPLPFGIDSGRVMPDDRVRAEPAPLIEIPEQQPDANGPDDPDDPFRRDSRVGKVYKF